MHTLKNNLGVHEDEMKNVMNNINLLQIYGANSLKEVIRYWLKVSCQKKINSTSINVD